ncbi:MAG: tetratricopeptide repeat protein [Chloroflexota bacterium]
MTSGDSGGARDELEASLRGLSARLADRPGDDAAHEARARALLAAGRLEDAERDAMDAVRLDPDEVRYRELLAEIQSQRGDHADAAAEYARLARNDPRQVAWTVAEAAERIESAETEKGVEAARRAVRLEPANFDAQLALARGLIRLGDGAGALQASRRAADLRPGDAAGREAHADALWLAEQAAAAFDEFKALATEISGMERERVLEKARSVYRRQAGWLGKWVASVRWLFRLGLERGWLNVA